MIDLQLVSDTAAVIVGVIGMGAFCYNVLKGYQTTRQEKYRHKIQMRDKTDLREAGR